MLNYIKGWFCRPIIIVGIFSLLISVLAQKKDYWKNLDFPEAFQNLSFFIHETRALEFVLADQDPDAFDIVDQAMSTKTNDKVLVEKGYQNKHHLYFFAKGRIVEEVAESEDGRLSHAETSRFNRLYLSHGKVFYWGVEIILAWLVMSTISLSGMRIISSILLFSLCETLRVCSYPIYILFVLILISILIAQYRKNLVRILPCLNKSSMFAFLFSIPCLFLMIRSIAHPELHWDVATYWLPRAYFISLHDTLFFNHNYLPSVLLPTYQGYPPLWSVLLSVPFSFFPQLSYAVGPLLLGLILYSLSEFLLEKHIPWPYILAACNFSFIYLYEHASYGYAQVITAASLIVCCWIIMDYQRTKWNLWNLLMLSMIIPLTRMESIVYLFAFLIIALFQKVPRRSVLCAGFTGFAVVILWSITGKVSGFASQSGRALDGIKMLVELPIGLWLERLGYILEYKLIRKKFNAEHYLMLVFLLSYLVSKSKSFRELFWEWRLIWLFFLLMWGSLIFLYFPVPVMNLVEMERIYMGTGFQRMYSHFVPSLFILLPFVLFIAFKEGKR